MNEMSCHCCCDCYSLVSSCSECGEGLASIYLQDGLCPRCYHKKEFKRKGGFYWGKDALGKPISWIGSKWKYRALWLGIISLAISFSLSLFCVPHATNGGTITWEMIQSYVSMLQIISYFSLVSGIISLGYYVRCRLTETTWLDTKEEKQRKKHVMGLAVSIFFCSVVAILSVVFIQWVVCILILGIAFGIFLFFLLYLLSLLYCLGITCQWGESNFYFFVE